MELLMTAVIGGVIGWLASIVMKVNAQMGIIANVLVGIVGANLGAWLAGVIGFAPQSLLAVTIVAVGGAAVLIFLLRALGVFR